MLRVMERSLIVTQYSDGLNRFAQLDQLWRGRQLAVHVRLGHKKTLRAWEGRLLRVLGAPLDVVLQSWVCLVARYSAPYMTNWISIRIKTWLFKSCFQVILSNADCFVERMLEIIASDDVMLIGVKRHISIWMVMSISKTVDFGLQRTRKSYIRPLHTAKVSVWCGISKVGIVGPYFFEEGGYSNSDIRALCRDATQFSASTTSKFTG